MAQEFNCPHCGCPLLATQDTVRVPGAGTVEMLHRKIGHLRATIARLRGAGFNPPFRRSQMRARRHPDRVGAVPERRYADWPTP